MVILVASGLATSAVEPVVKWMPKVWRTRDGKTTVYYAVAETVEPNNFLLDKRYDWKVDGKVAEAWFSPDVLNAWHSEKRGVGELSRKPHIIYAEKREPDIYEKLAAAAPAQSVIPQVVKRAPVRQGDVLIQACRREVDDAVREYANWVAAKKAEQMKEITAKQAETMRIVREICDSYGQPNFVTRLPL